MTPFQPERIVTESGKEIKVDKKIAVANEKILQKGRDVHQALEREVHPETKIETESEADRWGVRCVWPSLHTILSSADSSTTA